MKKKITITLGITSIILMSFVTIHSSSNKNLKEVDSLLYSKVALENQICYGPAITTENLHNTEIAGPYDPNIYGKFANSWFRKYIIAVSAPAGWHFTGEPYMNCIRDDQGSFRWNNSSGGHDQYRVTQRNPNYIQATCWIGSRSIMINLACQATKD